MNLRSCVAVAILTIGTLPVFGTDLIPFQDGTPEDVVSAIDNVVAQPPKKKEVLKTLQSDLAKALRNEQTSIKVRERAAWALGRLLAKDQVKSLVEASRDKGLLVRSAAVNALLRMRARSGLDVFVDIAKNDPVLSMRQRAIVALGLLQWEKTIQPLVDLSSDPKPEIRGAATLAMAATHSKKNNFAQVMKEMSADQDPYVQEYGKVGLHYINKKSAEMRKHLESTDQNIRLFTALYFHANGRKTDLEAIDKAKSGEPDDETRFELTNATQAIKKRLAQKPKPATSLPPPKVPAKP